MKSAANATNKDGNHIYNLLKRSESSRKENESKIIIEFLYKRIIELEAELEELREKLHATKQDNDYGTE